MTTFALIEMILFDYLQEEKINVIPHPPYSSDLAPSDFWLFNYLKRDLDTYPDAENLPKAVDNVLDSMLVDAHKKTFKNWIERMKLCIEHRGDYFEHLL